MAARFALGMLGLLIGCGGAATPARSDAPTSAVRAPETTEDCTLALVGPADRDPPSAHIAPELYGRALGPVATALCACTRSDDRTRVLAMVVPERGEVRATAPEEPRIDACLGDRLMPGRFSAFEVPAGVKEADTGPAHLAPSRPGPVEQYRAKKHPAPAKPPAAARNAATTLVYSLVVDRRRGELRDASGPHVPDDTDVEER